MDKKRNLILMLLDLCAFAYYQDHGERARRSLEAACRLAERNSLPEAEMYRDIMRRLEQDIPKKEGQDLDDGPARLLDIASL